MKEPLCCLLLLMLIKSSQQFNVWSDWSAYSECTPECQIGTQTRTRTCVSAPCAGDGTETMSCNSLCGCQTTPCNNGGTCIQTQIRTKLYQCACAPGYYGNNSQNCDNRTQQVLQGSASYNIGSELIITSPFYPGQYPTFLDLYWSWTSATTTTFYVTFTFFDISAPNSCDCVNDYNSNIELLQQNGVGRTFLTTMQINNACPCIYDMLIVNNGNNTSITNTSKVFCNANTQGVPSSLTYHNTDTITITFISDQNMYCSSSGFNITVSIGICTSNPCQNGGNCSESTGAYNCLCLSPFTGTNCETDIRTSPCSVTLCQNGGNCTECGDAYTCLCPSPFTGTNCETDIRTSPCSVTPCQNGGNCTESGGAYTCSCLSPFTGTNCETDIRTSPCSVTPCQNGGNCTECGGAYTCSCPSPFTGTNCETDITISPCSVTQCQNGGNCTESGGAYMCSCPSPFTGTNCETISSYSTISGCSEGSCHNGGTCQCKCMCTDEWSGDTCKDKPTDNLSETIYVIVLVGPVIITTIIIVVKCNKSSKKRNEKKTRHR